MSNWLCYTRKILATAISSLAEELEQTALDLNEAVHSIGMSREASLEQKLYAIYDTDVPPGGSAGHKPRATTQQPVKSSVLPSHVVPGDVVLEDHFSPPPVPPQQQGSDVCPAGQVEERMSRSHCTPSVAHCMSRSQTGTVVKLGDKRPGKVVRTSSSESCSSQTADWCPEFDTKDWDRKEEEEDDETFQDATQTCGEREGVEERLKSGGEKEGEREKKSRWLTPLSHAVSLAYTQMTHAVLNLVEDVSDLSNLSEASTSMRDGHTTHLLHTRSTPDHSPTDRPCITTELSLDLSPAMCSNDSDTRCLMSPVSVRSTYSTDSFEVIDPVDNGAVSPCTDHTDRPIFILGEVEVLPPEMTTSSAEYVQFNFSNLVSGHYFRAKSPISHPSPCASVSDTSPEPHVINDQSEVRMKVNDPGFESQMFRTGEVLSKPRAPEDDDGSSFDILSEQSEEDYIVF